MGSVGGLGGGCESGAAIFGSYAKGLEKYSGNKQS